MTVAAAAMAHGSALTHPDVRATGGGASDNARAGSASLTSGDVGFSRMTRASVIERGRRLRFAREARQPTAEAATAQIVPEVPIPDLTVAMRWIDKIKR